MCCGMSEGSLHFDIGESASSSSISASLRSASSFGRGDSSRDEVGEVASSSSECESDSSSEEWGEKGV